VGTRVATGEEREWVGSVGGIPGDRTEGGVLDSREQGVQGLGLGLGDWVGGGDGWCGGLGDSVVVPGGATGLDGERGEAGGARDWDGRTIRGGSRAPAPGAVGWI
jgi:hypothetical protein